MPLQLDYFYGGEAEQYSFYRIPKAVFTDSHYETMTMEARVLYGETGLSVPPLTQTDLPFTVSLLRLLYLDPTPVYDLSDAFRRARRKLMETREARYAEEMREYVEAICDHHLYLEITRMDWRERFELAAERHYKNLPGDLLTDLLRERDITWIPSQIQTMQEQALALIEGVMDIELELSRKM